MPDEALLDVLMSRSAGNPLFVEQLALTAHRGDGPLPETLHHLLRARVEELPEESRRILGAAAVIGRRASLPLLARMQGVPEHELEEALRPALAARVVELRDDLRLDFHHPAFLEVVYGELMPGERVRLHLAAAEALAADQQRFPAVVGEMARHWHQAGELERALDASLSAGAMYSRMYAFGDAYAAYTRVLDLVERVPHELDLSEVRLLAAEAAHHVGDPDNALQLLELVRSETDDPHTHALAAERIGALHLMYGDGEAGERAFAEALGLLPEGETSVLAARIQGGLALLGVGWSRLDDAELAGTEEALRVARAVGARREEGIALNALGTTAALRGDLTTGGGHAAGGAGDRPRGGGPVGPRRGLRQPQPRPGHGRPARRVRGARSGRDRRADPVRPAAGAGQPAAQQRQRDPRGGGPVRRGRRAWSPRR